MPGQTEEDDAAQKVRELCARYINSQILEHCPLMNSRLIKYTVEGVRTHLDRVYLEAASRGGDVMHTQANWDAAEVTALQEELESLYTEILPVAQMSAEQQYLEPAIRLTATRSAQDGERSTKVITFVGSMSTIGGQYTNKNTDLQVFIGSG
jgi:hypothetical protein